MTWWAEPCSQGAPLPEGETGSKDRLEISCEEYQEDEAGRGIRGSLLDKMTRGPNPEKSEGGTSGSLGRKVPGRRRSECS